MIAIESNATAAEVPVVRREVPSRAETARNSAAELWPGFALGVGIALTVIWVVLLGVGTVRVLAAIIDKL